jgi:hypothetical protein
MPNILAFIIASLLLAVPLKAAAWCEDTAALSKSDFIDAIGDVPLHKDLYIADDFVTIYDTPAGRIVDVTAYGTIAPELALRYYETTLPALGWHPLAKNTYRRGDEMLSLSVETDECPGFILKFSVRPTP